VALKTTCIKNVKFKILKIWTGCQHVGYSYYRENLNWATQNLDWAKLFLSTSPVALSRMCWGVHNCLE